MTHSKPVGAVATLPALRPMSVTYVLADPATTVERNNRHP